MAKEVVGEILIRNWRLSFAELYERGRPIKDKDTGKESPGKFHANFLKEKTSSIFMPEKRAIDKVVRDVKIKKYGEDEKKWPKYRPDKVFLRDGDLEDWDGYEGMYYISASNDEQPQLITRYKDAKGLWVPAKKGVLYSGCYVNALLQIWAQDNVHGKRLNATLKVVQFNAPGEAFSSNGPVDVEEKFASIEADEGDPMGALPDFSEEEDDTGLV